jgi:hypothetical protein
MEATHRYKEFGIAEIWMSSAILALEKNLMGIIFS